MILEFFLLRWRWLLAGVLGITVAAVFMIQSARQPIFFAQVEEKVEKWNHSPEESYEEMKKLVKKGGLENRYGVQIAQQLVNRGEILEASPWASAPLEALQKEAPFHAAFGETSLLIEQGMVQEALERSVRLKEEMAKKTLLYAYNLLRIAFLQKELGNGPGEKVAWEELEAFLAESPDGKLLYANFKTKGVDLTHYIAERKRHI